MTPPIVTDVEQLAKWRSTFYKWAFFAEIVFFALGMLVGIKWGAAIMGMWK